MGGNSGAGSAPGDVTGVRLVYAVGVTRLHIASAHAREVLVPWRALLRNKWHEFSVKARGRRIKGQGMIGAPASQVADGFAALARDGFHEYNLPQAWVEARMLPQVLHGRVPALHAQVLDLGCGPATSTRIIAHFAHPTWRLWGYDLTAHLIDAAQQMAREGRIRTRGGDVVPTTFVCQDISKPLRSGAGEDVLPDGSVDLAVSGGVVGLYMSTQSTRQLAKELRRVLKPGGYAALDAGPAVPTRVLRTIMLDAGFTFDAHVKSFWIEPRPKLVFRVPSA